MHERDENILNQIQNYFGVGSVFNHREQSKQYGIRSIKDLQMIITHFDKFSLKTQNLNDYELFKKAYYIIINKEHLTKEGLDKLIQIKSLMNKGLSISGDLVKAFPHIKLQPVVKKTHANQIPNPN